jgi:hypothetical protein
MTANRRTLPDRVGDDDLGRARLPRRQEGGPQAGPSSPEQPPIDPRTEASSMRAAALRLLVMDCSWPLWRDLHNGGRNRALVDDRCRACLLMSWARLLKHVFDSDIQPCENRGAGELKIIATILERPVLQKILDYLWLDSQPPRLGCRQASALAGVHIAFLDPVQQRLRCAADLRRDRFDRRLSSEPTLRPEETRAIACSPPASPPTRIPSRRRRPTRRRLSPWRRSSRSRPRAQPVMPKRPPTCCGCTGT